MIKKYICFVAIFIFILTLTIYLFISNRKKLPEAFHGTWIANIKQTIQENRKVPTWKKEYENNILNWETKKTKMGYIITSDSISFTLNGIGTPHVYNVKEITENQAVLKVHDKERNIDAELFLCKLNSQYIKIKSNLSKFYVVYEKIKK